MIIIIIIIIIIYTAIISITILIISNSMQGAALPSAPPKLGISGGANVSGSFGFDPPPK